MKRIDISASKWYKGMPYGAPGSGKTHFCGTFSQDDRTAPVLHIDCGGNPETLNNLDRVGDVIQLEKLADLNYIYDWLFKGQPDKHPMVSEMGAKPGYKTIILDTGSDLQRHNFKSVMKEESLHIADTRRSPEFGDWRAVLATMTEIAYGFFKLPMHVVITAWEKTEVDASTGATRYRPFFTGQSIDTVPGYALNVGRMINPARAEGRIAQMLKDKPDAKSVIIFQPSKTYDAKDQNGFNIPAMINPTAAKLLDLLEK